MDSLYPVNSTWVDFVGLNNGLVFAVFNNGTCAQFQGTNQDDLNDLLASPSVGKYINENFKFKLWIKIPPPLNPHANLTLTFTQANGDVVGLQGQSCALIYQPNNDPMLPPSTIWDSGPVFMPCPPGIGGTITQITLDESTEPWSMTFQGVNAGVTTPPSDSSPTGVLTGSFGGTATFTIA